MSKIFNILKKSLNILKKSLTFKPTYTHTEQSIINILDVVLKNPTTVKITPLNGCYYVYNDNMNIRMCIDIVKVNLLIDNRVILINCDNRFGYELINMINNKVKEDANEVKEMMNIQEMQISDNIIESLNNCSQK